MTPPTAPPSEHRWKVVFSELPAPLELRVYSHAPGQWAYQVLGKVGGIMLLYAEGFGSVDAAYDHALHNVIGDGRKHGYGALREVTPQPGHTRVELEEELLRIKVLARRQVRWVLRRQAQTNAQLDALSRQLGLDIRVPRMVDTTGAPIKWSRDLLNGEAGDEED